MKKLIGNFGFLELVDKMGNDLTVVNSARVSMGKRKESFDEKDEKLVNYLADNHHTSPFRHCVVQFHIKAPEFVARQAFKHLIGTDYTFKDTAWNEISGRYVTYDQEFYFPDKFRKQSSSVKQGSSSEEVDNAAKVNAVYEQAIETAWKSYNELLYLGVCREQARFVLPFATYTEWYWTASLQAVKHFVNLRFDSHAQKEIQDYAVAMDEMMRELFPVAWKALDKKRK